MFEPVDIQQVKKKLRVDETSIEDGRRNLPRETDPSLDGNQAEILQHFTSLLDKTRAVVIAELQAGLTKMEELRGQLRARPFVEECKEQLSQFRDRLSRLQADHRDKLERLRLGERKLARDINYFRLKNELHREAHYPDSRILHWGIIITMIIMESLGNAYFFAEGSKLGYFGGWLQSILVSVLVILSSANLVGARVIPLMNYIGSWWKAIGMFLLALYLFLLLLFCLLVAHYRLLLTTDPDHALLQTLPHLIDYPFGIDPVSWIFFSVSVLFGISGVIAGYTSDDSYPGYGALDRRHKETERAYSFAKGELGAATDRVYDDTASAIDRIVGDAKELLRQHETKLPSVRTLHAEYLAYAAAVEQGCNAVLKAYRDRNKQVRTAPAPKYFDKDISFKDRIGLGVPDLSLAEGMSKEYQGTLTSLMETANQVRAELQTIAAEHRTKLRDFIAAVETAAMKRLEGDTSLAGPLGSEKPVRSHWPMVSVATAIVLLAIGGGVYAYFVHQVRVAENLYGEASKRFRASKFGEADSLFSKAIETKATASYHYSRGNVRLAMMRYEDAAQDYTRAIELQRNYAPPYFARGMLHWLLGKLPEAESDLRAATKLAPDDDLYHYRLSAVLYEQGKKDESTQMFRAAFVADPSRQWALQGWLAGLFAREQFDDVLKALSEYRARDTYVAWLYYYAGRVYKERNQSTLALEAFQHALHHDSQEQVPISIYFEIALLERKRNRNECNKNLAEYQRRMGRPDYDKQWCYK